MKIKGRLKRQLYVYNILSASVLKFIKDDCLTLASSISFYFLLSIIPFSSLAVALIKNVSSFLFKKYDFGGSTLHMFEEEITRLIPFVTRDWFESHLFTKSADISLTIFNLILLPIVCGVIFKTLETAYRKIFKMKTRNLVIGHAVYAVMSISAVFFLFLFNFFWTIFTTTIIRIFSFVDMTIPFISKGVEILIDFKGLHTHLTSAVILVLFFMVTVRFFISRKIKWTYQAASGLLFYLLWNMARLVFSFYINHLSKLNILYGSLSSVIVLLLWIYYSAAVLLFCVVVMYVLEEKNTVVNENNI